MTDATFLVFTHPADLRGWLQGQQPPHCACDHGSATSGAFGPIGMGRKSLPPARVAPDTIFDPS